MVRYGFSSREQVSAAAQRIYLAVFAAYLVLATVRTTSLEYRVPPYFTAAIAAGLIAIIAVQFFVLHMYSIKEAAVYAVFLVVVLVIVLRNHHDTLMMLSLLVIASKGMNYRKIVMVHFIVCCEVLAFSAILSQLGISSDYGEWSNGNRLYTFGVCSTTDFAAYMAFLVMEYTFLRGKKITYVELAGFAVLNVFIYKFTMAKTAFVGILFFCVLVFLYKILLHHAIDPVEWKITCLAPGVMPVLALIMLGLSYCYNAENPVMREINGVLSQRPYMGRIALDRYGIGLFGNGVVECGFGFGNVALLKQFYFFIDSSYMRLFVIDGLIVTLVVMLLYGSIVKKLISKKNMIGVIIVLTITCVSFMEQHLLEPWYNVSTLLFLTMLQEKDITVSRGRNGDGV